MTEARGFGQEIIFPKDATPYPNPDKPEPYRLDLQNLCLI
jgi:hypothetical protein